MARGRSMVGRILVGIAVLGVLSVLFMRTLRETTSAPYQVRSEHLAGWALTLDPPLGPGGPLLALTPPRELTLDLFNQIFARTMESMNTPPAYAVTLVLRSEFSNGLAGLVEPGELLDLAREAGLDSATFQPRCLAEHRSADQRGRTFFALFDLPELRAFREQVLRLAAERGGDASALDPAAMVPALYLAATEGGFRGWPVADGAAEEHCVAPLEVSSDL